MIRPGNLFPTLSIAKVKALLAKFFLGIFLSPDLALTNGIDLLLHETGVAPDIHGRTNTFMKIEKGHQYSIGTEATLIEVTESFKQMDLSKRECIVNGNHKYHEVNCYFEQMIDFSIKKCKCGICQPIKKSL